MDPLADTKQTDDPHDASAGLSRQDIELVARADERLAHAYEQIARADEQLARVNEQLSKMEQDAAPKKSANGYRRPSRGRPALRGLVGLLLTAGICIAAFASQSSGVTAKLMNSRWAPQLAAASPLPAETPKRADQQSPPAVQLATADVSQIPPSAQTAPQDAAAAPIPPELTQLLQTMARDLANVQQGIEQLKTSQEEMVRAIANVSEQNLRRRASAASPPPIATPARGPVSALPPTEARAQARAPMPLRPGQQ
jgi:hypothetical protein